jgi:hypothetical protein
MNFHEQHGLTPAGHHGAYHVGSDRPALQVYVMVVMNVRKKNTGV